MSGWQGTVFGFLAQVNDVRDYVARLIRE